MRIVAVACAALGLAAAAVAGTTGGRIVFAADDAPQASGDVIRLDANGHRVDLGKSPFTDSQPVVAPAGGHVAFVSDRGGARAVYTVRIDGTVLRRVTGFVRSGTAQILAAWSPDGSTLAVATVDGLAQTGRLYLSAAGRTREVTHLVGAQSISWTPDGRLLTVLDGAFLDALSPANGRRAWSVPIRTASTGWTAAGLFAGDDGNGHVLVVDERGRIAVRLPGSSPAFSQDGLVLAQLHGALLEIRTAAGTLRHELRLPRGVNGFTWTGPRTIFVPTATAALVVNAATGGVRRAAYAYPVVRRLNGYSATTVKSGNGFAVRVTDVRGRTRTFGRVPACTDDGAVIAAVDSLQPTADGRSVVYETDCLEPYANLYAVPPSGGPAKRLTNVPREQASPALSPDGAHLAYVQSPFTGLSCKGCPSTLWVADADGSHPKQLTHLPFCVFDSSPSWSPDGSRIVFSRAGCDDDERPRLLTTPPRGGAVADPHIAGGPVAWGPNRIAYVATGTGELWTALPDGTDAKQVRGGTNASAFAWSSYGALAFAVRRRDGRIRLGSFDGTRVRWAATPFVVLTSLAWSPDGTRLVAAAKPKGGATADVFTLAPDGTRVRRLTRNVDALGVTWR